MNYASNLLIFNIHIDIFYKKATKIIYEEDLRLPHTPEYPRMKGHKRKNLRINLKFNNYTNSRITSKAESPFLSDFLIILV